MKLTIISVSLTLFIISLSLNLGLVAGYVKIGTPKQLAQTAYNDTQSAMMTALVEKSQ